MNTVAFPVDASHQFAELFVATDYGDLSAGSIDVAKKSVLDTVGVSLAATSLSDDALRLRAMAIDLASPNGSAILGFGGRASAPMAAWINGALAHPLDFDDIAYDAFAHPSAAVVPAMLAVAEKVGGVSGRDFIVALALAQDMVVRLSSSLDWKDVAPLRWLPFPLVGVFAAAAACSKLLKLDVGQTQSAIGIALAHAAGAGELQFGSVRGLYDSWAASGGVIAALMAQKGIKGPARPLEGDRGFFAVYWKGAYDRQALVAGLGVNFQGETTGFKAWPSCAVTHPAIDAALKLVTSHDVKADEIEEVVVRVSPAAWPQCNPLAEKRRPATIMDAKFSIPFTVALACIRRGVKLSDFTADRITDPVIRALATRITPVEDTSLRGERGVDPCEVQVRVASGAVHVVRTSVVYGHHANPMGWSALTDKFMDCASYASTAPKQDAAAAFAMQISALEDMRDVGQLLATLEQ